MKRTQLSDTGVHILQVQTFLGNRKFIVVYDLHLNTTDSAKKWITPLHNGNKYRSADCR